MSIGVWNILDLVDDYGEEYVNAFISDFTTGINKEWETKNLKRYLQYMKFF